MIVVASARVVEGRSHQQIEASYGVSPKSVQRYCRLAPTFAECPPILSRFAAWLADNPLCGPCLGRGVERDAASVRFAGDDGQGGKRIESVCPWCRAGTTVAS